MNLCTCECSAFKHDNLMGHNHSFVSYTATQRSCVATAGMDAVTPSITLRQRLHFEMEQGLIKLEWRLQAGRRKTSMFYYPGRGYTQSWTIAQLHTTRLTQQYCLYFYLFSGPNLYEVRVAESFYIITIFLNLPMIFSISFTCLHSTKYKLVV